MTSRTSQRPRRHFVAVVVATAAWLVAPAGAWASKEAVDYFGTSESQGTRGGEFDVPIGVAVNNSGAGPANSGDVYVADSSNNRVQHFGHDDNGTPGDTTDDSYFFISTWGAGVLSGGTTHQVCTVAADCGPGTATGNNGGLNAPSYLAVDQDTGDVYVSEYGNNRVSVFDGSGTFLRSFGFDVVASGPGNAGTGYEVCVAANGDTCKTGVAGSGTGQLGHAGAPTFSLDLTVTQPDGNASNGTLYVADAVNNRIGTFALDGSAPSSIGSFANFGVNRPDQVAIDSRGILYASAFPNHNEIARYDTENANGLGVGFLDPIPVTGVNEVQKVTVSATAGTFRLSFDPDGAGPRPTETTTDIPYDFFGREPGNPDPDFNSVADALRALPSFPGNFTISNGPAPFTITFEHALGTRDVPEMSATDGTPPLSGGAGASVTTETQGQTGLAPSDNGIPVTTALDVDPDSDGPGPDIDKLYVARKAGDSATMIYEFGGVNPPGLVTAPTDVDDVHGTDFQFQSAFGLGLDEETGRLYLADSGPGSAGSNGIYVLDNAGPPPSASLDSVDTITPTSATAHATINPNGPPATSYHLEYSTDGTQWSSTPQILLGTQSSPQLVDIALDPAGTGLEPSTQYQVRLVAGRRFSAPIVTSALTFTTPAASPAVETVGSPVRSATTAQLEGRVNPRGSATTYHFEYGTDGPCSVPGNTCATTPAHAVGSGNEIRLVAASLTGLAASTTYHYRLVAENAAPGSPSTGDDMTVKTRASDEPLAHGPFPGPPGSDRAWEQVSLPDSSGNAISQGLGFSDDGTRALYRVAGGTAIADSGSLAGIYYAERGPNGWQTRTITPPRAETVGASWGIGGATDDLSSVLAVNLSLGATENIPAFWLLSPTGPPQELLLPAVRPQSTEAFGLSADGSRALAVVHGSGLDPAYPQAGPRENLYDISADPPQLVSLLPGEVIPGCGGGNSVDQFGMGMPQSHWISPDGSTIFFPSRGHGCSFNANGIFQDGPSSQFYMRDIDAGQTTLISGPPVSGKACGAVFLKAIPDAAFFWTQTRLTGDDTVPADCVGTADGDVYRYDLSSGSLDCVTCVVPGVDAGVPIDVSFSGGGLARIAVAEDGSRLYFSAASRLLPGVPSGGAYRLDLDTNDLAYVGPGQVGEIPERGSAITPDGSVLIFRSADPGLNAVSGQDNGGSAQYYRYDDLDRSLVCISCPPDGAAATADVPAALAHGPASPNATALSSDGATIAFATSTPLAAEDHNTAQAASDPERGGDVYEWRDGRLLLISDGSQSWPATPAGIASPRVAGVSPSGNDVYFLAAAQYTPDALDAYTRLYDARIGGGFAFPEPEPPCSLEDCQGPATSAPESSQAGSATHTGPGNSAPLDCSKAEAKLAKAKRKLARAEGKKAKARARRAVKKANRRLKACERGVR